MAIAASSSDAPLCRRLIPAASTVQTVKRRAAASLSAETAASFLFSRDDRKASPEKSTSHFGGGSAE